jgi:large subunit ribosomal protein L13
MAQLTLGGKTLKTYMAKAKDIKRKWYVIDASGNPLGRVAAEVATILRGKHQPIYTPNVDTGDFVIVINAGEVKLTGDKPTKKMYTYHTGYPGGIRHISYQQLLQKNPEKVIEVAVKGMMPGNRLGRQMLKKLKVYRGPEHPHQAQQPEKWEIRG